MAWKKSKDGITAKYDGWCERWPEDNGPGCGGKVIAGETMIRKPPSGSGGKGHYLHTQCVTLLEAGEDVPPSKRYIEQQAAKAETVEAPKGSKVTATMDKVAAVVGAITVCVRTWAGIACTIPSKWKDVVLSTYQENVIIKVLTTECHLLLEAGPGCGKTFIGKFILWCANVSGVCISFNTHTAKVLAKSGDLPKDPAVDSKTSHSVGLAILKEWRKSQSKGGIDIRSGIYPDKRVSKILSILWDLWSERKSLASDIRAENRAKIIFATEIISKCKAQLLDTTQDARGLISRFNISTAAISDSAVDEVLNEVPGILQRCEDMIRDEGIIDMDDMIWGVHRLKITPKSRRLVFIDEAQDFTPGQLHLGLALAGDTGRVVMVGDPRQAIYVWRGAAQNGMDDAYHKLSATKRGCIRLPLLLTYRCPKSHVAFCNMIFPDAKNKLEALDTAIDGVFVKINSATQDWIGRMTEEGLLGNLIIVCRTNSPLISGALECLARGQKAVVMGRNFADTIIKLIKDIAKKSGQDIDTFITVLREYERQEVAKAEKRGADTQTLKDKVQGIAALADSCESVGPLKGKMLPDMSTLLGKIAAIFNDDTTDAVVFSTVHQVKGLEANYIAILRPELMPGPWAETAQQIKEEKNIQWVAYSRSKFALMFVDEGAALPTGYGWTELEAAIAGNPDKGPSDGAKVSTSPQAETDDTHPAVIAIENRLDDGEVVPEAEIAKAEALQEDADEREAIQAADPEPSKQSVDIHLYSTLDVRGHNRGAGEDAIRHVRMEGGRVTGKSKTKTARKLGWQYHVIKKANELIRERLGKGVALPALPDMKRGRDGDDATPEKWSKIIEAYKAAGLTVSDYQVERGYERVFIISASA